VDAEREGHRRVPESLAGDLGIDLGLKRSVGVAVSDVMEPDAGQAAAGGEPVEALADDVRVDGTAVFPLKIPSVT
jgi:hypothetical protein